MSPDQRCNHRQSWDYHQSWDRPINDQIATVLKEYALSSIDWPWASDNAYTQAASSALERTRWASPGPVSRQTNRAFWWTRQDLILINILPVVFKILVYTQGAQAASSSACRKYITAAHLQRTQFTFTWNFFARVCAEC